MKKRLLIILLGNLFFCQQALIAQTRFYRNNQIEIDKAKIAFKGSCIAFGSTKEIGEKKLTADKKLLGFLNDFYNKDWSVDETAKQLTLFCKDGWKFSTTDLGGLVKYETKIANTGNLGCSISFSVFQNDIVFKKIYFHTLSETRCISPRYEMHGTQDLNYVDINFLPQINFPLVFSANAPAQSNETYSDKLNNYKGQVYKMITTDSTRINEMVWNQDDTYKADTASTALQVLAKNHNTVLLYKLLYSPNHVVAINAMEALLFLQESGVVKLPPDYLQKIEAIKSSPVKITALKTGRPQAVSTYKDLEISTEQVVAKYSR